MSVSIRTDPEGPVRRDADGGADRGNPDGVSIRTDPEGPVRLVQASARP